MLSSLRWNLAVFSRTLIENKHVYHDFTQYRFFRYVQRHSNSNFQNYQKRVENENYRWKLCWQKDNHITNIFGFKKRRDQQKSKEIDVRFFYTTSVFYTINFRYNYQQILRLIVALRWHRYKNSRMFQL